MFLKLTIALTIYSIIGVHLQSNRGCDNYDFIGQQIILQFEPCTNGGNMFVMKSYADVPIESFESDVAYHLGAVSGYSGYSCIATKQNYKVDRNTVVSSMVYLNPNMEADTSSFYEIQVFDTDQGISYTWDRLQVHNEWKQLVKSFDYDLEIENAKFEIHAFTTNNTLLAIEYLDIEHRLISDMYCYPRSTTPRHREPTTTSPTSPTKKTTSSTPCTPTTPTLPKEIRSNVYNIYNFISFFNFTSKIIN